MAKVGSFCGLFAFVSTTRCIFTAHIKITCFQLPSLSESSLQPGTNNFGSETSEMPNFDLCLSIPLSCLSVNGIAIFIRVKCSAVMVVRR